MGLGGGSCRQGGNAGGEEWGGALFVNACGARGLSRGGRRVCYWEGSMRTMERDG